jgi:carbonic anhydrase/acetyltransferase-like protein (isoleucine patch superfamily)
VGDVQIDSGCYIGPGAVLRGDWGGIRVGKGSNVQENCVIHVRVGDVVELGVDSHVGHGAIIHGAVLEAGVLVGMGAILFDGVRVGADSVIGAGAVLSAGLQVPPRSLVMGVPARIHGQVSDEVLEGKRRGTALYQTLPPIYRDQLREVPREEVKRLP